MNEANFTESSVDCTLCYSYLDELGLDLVRLLLNNDFNSACSYLIQNISNPQILEQTIEIFLVHLKNGISPLPLLSFLLLTV